MTEHDRLLVPGRTCWRIERANQFALIVDAADYFCHAKAAMLKAKHTIMLIGCQSALSARLAERRR